MANPFNKPISKVSVKQLLELDPDAISRLNARESRTYEKRLRNVASKRLNTIERYKQYSPAKEAYIPKGLPTMSKPSDTRQKSQHNIAVLKQFLNAKTSTLTGIRENRKEVTSRIFGTDKRGRPLYVFKDIEEERRFWNAYEEFLHQYPTYAFQSTRVQQFLAKETFWRTRSFNAGDFSSLLVDLQNNETGVDIRALAAFDEYI